VAIRHAACAWDVSGMDDDRPRPRSAETPVTYLSPTRAQLVRYFAWGYLSRRELNAKLRATDTYDSRAA
jgi:hypothetical protein